MNIEEFIKRYSSNNTKRGYRTTLKTFFNVVGINPDSYFNQSRDYEKDVEMFFQYRMNQNCAPKTINSDLGCIKTYLSFNRVDLPSIVWKDMRRRMGGTRARIQDKLPDVSELKAIFSHMNVRGRAFFLTMVSSGMRIEEVTEITFADIHLDEDPIRVIVRGNHTKTKNTRTAFISQEAKEAIEEWLKVRDIYVNTVNRRLPKINKDPNDIRVFPFGSRAGRVMWNDALKKSGLEDWDESFSCLVDNGYRGRRTMHPHSLRQYFRTYAGTVVNQNIAEALIGHEQGIVSVYARFQKGAENELAKQYKEKVEAKVSIFSVTGELQKIQQEAQKQTEEIERQRESLSHMVHQNLSLEDKVGELKTQSERIAVLEQNISMIHELFKDILADKDLQKWLDTAEMKYKLQKSFNEQLYRAFQ